MELILHIGMHKTGSSSIQETLYSAKLPPSYTYISFGSSNGSLLLLRGYAKAFFMLPNNKKRHASDKEKKCLIDSSRGLILRRVQQAIHDSMIKVAIISAEDLVRFSEEELGKFVSELFKVGVKKIKAIGYVREPFSYAQSVFQQRIKNKE